jgi:hypothetical protein
MLAILLLVAFGMIDNKEDEIIPALEIEKIFVKRCKIHPYIPKYERAFYHTSEFVGKVEPLSPFPFGFHSDPPPPPHPPVLSRKLNCARNIPRPILPFYHKSPKSIIAAIMPQIIDRPP